jgi:hypothetical protein
MMSNTPLVAQEVYLQERFSSVEHLWALRCAWKAMLDHAENMLTRYQQQLPNGYADRHISQQPDQVWGQHVLVQFRYTMALLDYSHQQRQQGDWTALNVACGAITDLRSQSMDYPADWMDEVEAKAADQFAVLRDQACDLAWPMVRTIEGVWQPGDLSGHYTTLHPNLPLNLPASLPTYRLNTNVTVKTGERTTVTGFYLPDVANSFPTLLIQSDDERWGLACAAMVSTQDRDKNWFSSEQACTWTLIEQTLPQ